MIKILCKFASPLLGSMKDGRWRNCNHPQRGGQCRKLIECQTCELHVAVDPPAPPPPPRPGPIERAVRAGLEKKKTRQPAPKIPEPFQPCSKMGTVLEWCNTCGKKDTRHVFDCEVHERCTKEPVNPAVMNCRKCQAEGLGFEPIIQLGLLSRSPATGNPSSE